MSLVSIVKCGSYNIDEVYECVREAVDLVGGIKEFLRPGQNVLLKINLLSATPPEKAVNTHPSFIGACVRLIKEAGGNPWVGDTAPTDRLKGKDVFDITGIREIVEKEGGEIINFSRSGFKKVKVPYGKKLKEVYLAKPCLEADVIVSLPKLKTHQLTFLTGAVKNFFGCIPSSDRLRAHSLAKEERFSQAVVDVYSVCKPSFAIMDAILAMEKDGPSYGDPVKLGLLLASLDPVSLDIVASQIIGFNPLEILTTRDALERGLGPSSLEEVKVVGCRIDEVKRPDFKKPATYRGRIRRTLIRIFTPFGVRFFRNFPAVKSSECRMCNICKENCPAGAIKMNPYPEFDYKKCIMCFCCYELCPYGAIYIKRNWLVERFGLF